MKTIAILLLSLVVSLVFARGIYEVAYAQGAAEISDAGVSAAPTAPAPAVSAASAGIEWNPLGWDWPWILGTSVTILGGVIMALRPIAAATKWTGDNWLLAKLEWLLATITRLFLPPKMRA
jgi:hypothetical protein